MAKNMTKYIAVIVVAILALATVVFITSTEDSDGEYVGPVDAAGNALTSPTSFSTVPKTIASTTPVITELLIAMDYTSKIITVSSNCDGPIVEGILASGQAVPVGSYFNPENELLFNATADVTFFEGVGPYTETTSESMRDSKLRSVMLHGGSSISEIYENIRIIGLVMGDFSIAENLISDMNSSFNEVKAKAAGAINSPKVMVNLGYDWGMGSVYGACGGTFAHEMIVMSNSANVLGDVPGGGWKKISNEILMDNSTNPEIIIVLAQTGQTYNATYWGGILDDLVADPIWGATNAVSNDRVYLLKESAANIGQRSTPGLTDFAKLMLIYTHPELFDTLGVDDLPKMIGDEYSDFIATHW